ncbi:MAG: GNAT family N-acetyltransferase [Propionibacteriales bacterium]|nr:GNAT family N-acetyltransferase [Propionibacteriales bacterium]
MTIVVRPPVVEDIDRLAVVNVEAWRHAYTGIVVQQRLDEMDLDEYRSRWQLNLTDPTDDRTCLVAEIDGVLAAYGIAGGYRPQDEADETPDTAGLGELYAIYAHPEFQGIGAGKAVHDAVLARLSENGYAEAALWILRDNIRTRAWYARQGWRGDGGTSAWVALDIAHPEIRLRRSTSGSRNRRA